MLPYRLISAFVFVALVSKSKLSRQFSVAVQLGLCLNWLETGTTGFSCKLAHIHVVMAKSKKKTHNNIYVQG